MKIRNSARLKGFTLIELLVVVLIIGILSAIAVPMYQKIVEKSKLTYALQMMDSVYKAEQAYRMEQWNYATNFDYLSLSFPSNQTQSENTDKDSISDAHYDYTLKTRGILAARNTGDYFLYQDYDTKQIMCTPSEHFICNEFEGLTKEPCQNAGLSWANTNTTCYSSDEARCKGLYDDSVWNGEFCGYTNKWSGEFKEGMKCQGDGSNNTCAYDSFTDGAVCDGEGKMSCYGSTFTEGAICKGQSSGEKDIPCYFVTVKNGGICEGLNGGYGDWYKSSCIGTTVQEGGICQGKAPSACQQSSIYAGGVCIGEADSSCGSVTIAGGICQGDGTNSCRGAIIDADGVCEGNAQGSCSFLQKVKEGGKCIANAPGTCQLADGWYGGYWNSAYEGTGATSGCCEGAYCPSSAPRCECANHEKMNESGVCI